MATIQTKGLTYRYGIGTPFEKTAVDHVDLEIESGSFVGIIGHTGSGKSTLIQHLNGLLKPTEGSILLDGKDIWAEKAQMRQVRFRVGLVFQYPEYQIFEETVAKDIAFGPRNMGLAEEEVQARVKETAAIVGLSDDILEQSPFLLSGGQKRRVAIARALLAEYDIFGMGQVKVIIQRMNRNVFKQPEEPFPSFPASVFLPYQPSEPPEIPESDLPIPEWFSPQELHS